MAVSDTVFHTSIPQSLFYNSIGSSIGYNYTIDNL